MSGGGSVRPSPGFGRGRRISPKATGPICGQISGKKLAVTDTGAAGRGSGKLFCFRPVCSRRRHSLVLSAGAVGAAEHPADDLAIRTVVAARIRAPPRRARTKREIHGPRSLTALARLDSGAGGRGRSAVVFHI